MPKVKRCLSLAKEVIWKLTFEQDSISFISFFSFFSLFVGNMAAFDMSLPEAVVSPGKVKKKSTS